MGVRVTVGNGSLPKWIAKHITAIEIANLEKLVGEIERKTEGEIVPVLVRQSLIGKIPLLARGKILKKLFFSENYLRVHADLRAELEFYRARIYHTKKKTGILLFMSFYEHRAVVLADSGIAQVLPATTWDEVVRLLSGAMKEGRLADGLTKAITQCGEVLIQHFPQQDIDENQIGNHIRISD